MSSENKTPNLQLNQWKGNEYPKRADFIDDNKKIDEAYKELKDSIKNGGKVSSVNGKIGDVILKAEDIKTESGDTVQSQMAEMTQQRKIYEELKNMIENKQLKAGTQYVLIDYRTKYIQPTTNALKEMEVEELVLTANSESTFEPIVSSLKYPEDLVYYDFNNNICEDKATPRNGFILRRYDPISKNDAPQDWRSMLWARYKPNKTHYMKNGVETIYSTWVNGGAKLNFIYKADNKLWMAKNTNVPTSPTDSNVFNEVYPDLDTPMLIDEKTKIAKDIELIRGDLVEVPTFESGCIGNNIGAVEEVVLHNNVFSKASTYNLLLVSCTGNTFHSNSYRNTLNGRCFKNIFINAYSNSFGNDCYGNYLPKSCRYNSFGNGCYGNSLGFNCFYNSFGNGCYNNSFVSTCFHNTFGNSCHDNSFGDGCYGNDFVNNCYRNRFDNACTENSFGVSCYDNVMGNACSSNILECSCYKNIFGNNCLSNSFGNKCFNNNLEKYFSRNNFESYCHNNSFNEACTDNIFGNSFNNNTFGASSSRNTFGNDCVGNTFGGIFRGNIVKLLKNKNVSSVNGPLIAENYTVTIESNPDSGFFYWYVDSTGTIKVVKIP
ncbi:type II toxin-antitoxin system RelE/ParE family toxin [Clostridium sp. Marseille-QA1073]